jgi:hypothetical protein
MFHLISVAVILIFQYLFVYSTYRIYEKYYDIYENDFEIDNDKKQYIHDNSKEYAFLMNEKDDDQDE